MTTRKSYNQSEADYRERILKAMPQLAALLEDEFSGSAEADVRRNPVSAAEQYAAEQGPPDHDEDVTDLG